MIEFVSIDRARCTLIIGLKVFRGPETVSLVVNHRSKLNANNRYGPVKDLVESALQVDG